ERVKHQLEIKRGEILNRHAEELKALDTEQDEIDAFERLADGFAQKYMSSKGEAPGSELETTWRPIDADGAESPIREIEQKIVSVGAQVRQQASPNFEPPPRLRRFIGG